MDHRDQRTLIIASVIGIIFGGLAGLLGGVFVTSGKIASLGHYLSVPRVVRDDRREDVLSEERATIDAVRAARPAVVSVVVRKTPSASARGNVFNFDEFLEFGLPLVPRRNRDQGPEDDRGGDASDEDRYGGFEQVGGGSGFIVTSDGFIVTNRHVVANQGAQYAVVLNDDREFEAVVRARDPVHDIAILKIDADEPLPVLALGDSDAISIGETVIAIGYALSEFRNTVTKGVISGVNREVVAGDRSGGSETIHEAIQTDAAINLGNSGGPLLNLRGEVIGVNTAVSSAGQLLGFAIPISIVEQAVESVIAEGRIVRPWLGVRYFTVTPTLHERRSLPEDHGALIVAGAEADAPGVVPESPAALSGLQVGDLIVAVNGQRVDVDHPLVSRVNRFRAGDAIALTVFRDGRERTITVTLGEFPNER